MIYSSAWLSTIPPLSSIFSTGSSSLVLLSVSDIWLELFTTLFVSKRVNDIVGLYKTFPFTICGLTACVLMESRNGLYHSRFIYSVEIITSNLA